MGDDVFDDSVEGENLTGEKDLLRLSQDLYKVHNTYCNAHTRGPVAWSIEIAPLLLMIMHNHAWTDKICIFLLERI